MLFVLINLSINEDYRTVVYGNYFHPAMESYLVL